MMGKAAETLHTERLLLRAPAPQMSAAMRDFHLRNEAHFAPWNPPAPEGAYELAMVEKKLLQGAAEFSSGTAYRYLISLRDDPARLIGQAQLSQVARGPFQNAMLGYSLDAQAQGQGLMREALRAIIEHCFAAADLRLHRLQAAVRPENQRSMALLKALGFEQEGFGRRYLFINGAWRDHAIYALLNPHWGADEAP
jgi:ribosomal-protein-alanine N-acetyltransferase